MFYKAEECKSLLSQRHILIAGYGREGKSSERLLQQLLPASQFDVVDGNEAIVKAAPHYDLILKSPGIPTAVFDGVVDKAVLSSQTDIFLQLYGTQTVGITGTKGKSTTTQLIYNILSAATPVKGRYNKVLKAGNMGIPLFDIVSEMDADVLAVAELSCHQLECLHRAPAVAVLLNLFQEHLDHYVSYRAYQMAKLNIALCQQPDDHFFYCSDNAELASLVDEYRGKIASNIHAYSVTNPFECTPSASLQGAHNLSNVTVAADVAALFGIDDEVVSGQVQHFEGLHYRMEYVGCYRGIHFYDDSISTIPASAIAAVQALPDVETLILGGFDRGIDYMPLAQFLATASVCNLVFVGQAGRRIQQLYNTIPSQAKRNILVSDSYDEIVRWCYQHTSPGKICMLSPAAASYDSFKNFEQRGDTFDQLVRKYGTTEC